MSRKCLGSVSEASRKGRLQLVVVVVLPRGRGVAAAVALAALLAALLLLLLLLRLLLALFLRLLLAA